MEEKNKKIIFKIKNIITNLSEVYGTPIWKPRLKPMDELIFTVLTIFSADLSTKLWS